MLAHAAADGVCEWFNYQGNPINAKPVNSDNGGYYESVSYGNMSYVEYLKFRCAYREKYGKAPFEDTEYLYCAADYFVKTFYPSDCDDYHIPFGDTTGKGIVKSAISMAYEGVDSKELRWYLQNIDHREIDLMDVIGYSEIWEKDTSVPAENSVFYEKIGWAVFRDSYEKNSTMLAVKCGDTWNHAHADAGHFVLYKDGVPVIRDSGTCDYGHPLYVPYYQSSQAHNVVLFNGKGQDERDFVTHARLTGKLYNFVNQDGFRYIAADATGPLSRFFRKHLRHILWLDGFILIYDDIDCYEQGELSFLLHAEDNCSFKMLTPHTEDVAVGYKNAEPDKSVNVKVYKMNTDDECHGKFVSVILLDENLVAELSDVNDGYKVKCGDTTVYINCLSDGRIMHRNCQNVMDEYLTDAVIITENKGKFGVVNGSIIRKNDEVILDTLTRINGLV